MADKSDEEEADFVRRSAPANIPSAHSSPDKYLPRKCIRINTNIRYNLGY